MCVCMCACVHEVVCKSYRYRVLNIGDTYLNQVKLDTESAALGDCQFLTYVII